MTNKNFADSSNDKAPFTCLTCGKDVVEPNCNDCGIFSPKTAEEKYKMLCRAYVYKEDRGEYFINEKLSKQDQEIVLDLQHTITDDFGANYDLRYQIMAHACQFIDEIPLDELKRFKDSLEWREFASVYTGERLSYLTVNNQYDISEIYKETGADDIATACAIWYDRAVNRVIDELINGYIFA